MSTLYEVTFWNGSLKDGAWLTSRGMPLKEALSFADYCDSTVPRQKKSTMTRVVRTPYKRHDKK